MNNQTTLKTLPLAPTKKQAVDIFMKQGRTERNIRNTINKIIAKNRSLPEQYVRFRNLIDVEFLELIKIFGVPVGYQKPQI